MTKTNQEQDEKIEQYAAMFKEQDEKIVQYAAMFKVAIESFNPTEEHVAKMEECHERFEDTMDAKLESASERLNRIIEEHNEKIGGTKRN